MIKLRNGKRIDRKLFNEKMTMKVKKAHSDNVIFIINMAKVITKEMFTNEKPRKIILLRKILTIH